MMNHLKKNGFLLALGGVFIVGAFLRLYALPSQIVLDDEWHNLTKVIAADHAGGLMQFDPHDNTNLPLIIYDLTLYHTLGWSEFTVRLPVILAGLLSLVCLPLLIRKNFNDRVSLIFSGLLAIAPFLIFYSRYVRAYGLVMPLCFSALFLFYQWLTTGKLRYAVGFALAGIFAAYTHLASLIAVATPLMTAIGFKLFNRLRAHPPAGRQIVLSLKNLLTMALILIIALVPLMIPVFLVSAHLPWQMGKMTLDGVVDATTLVSGTANLPLNILFIILCFMGQRLLLRQNLLLGWMFLSVICAYIGILLISHPLGINKGAVLLRYMIVIVPMALTMAALAIDWFLTQAHKIKWLHPGMPLLFVAGFMGSLYAAGPLPAQHLLPNNFAHHSAFQASYARHTWEFSEADTVYPAFPVKINQMPPFYLWLRGQSNIEAIVEYPFDICDYNNVFYYYQHFHKKRVAAGYCLDPTMSGYETAATSDQLEPTFSIGMLSLDQIFSQVTDPSKLAFRNMVDILDAASLSRSRADVIVLHKYIMALTIMPGDSAATPTYGRIQVHYHSVELLRGRFIKLFGPPAYEDEQIICFYIKQPNPGNRSPVH
jgi:uncharacterized membrane protein